MSRWIPWFDHTYCIPQELESGIARVGDLEWYVQGDVIKCGGGLSELGKKFDHA